MEPWFVENEALRVSGCLELTRVAAAMAESGSAEDINDLLPLLNLNENSDQGNLHVNYIR